MPRPTYYGGGFDVFTVRPSDCDWVQNIVNLTLTHSLTAALDRPRVAISTTSGPGLRIDRH